MKSICFPIFIPLLALLLTYSPATAQQFPNIIFIFADDIGTGIEKGHTNYKN
jgi:hypothetical protein